MNCQETKVDPVTGTLHVCTLLDTEHQTPTSHRSDYRELDGDNDYTTRPASYEWTSDGQGNDLPPAA